MAKDNDFKWHHRAVEIIKTLGYKAGDFEGKSPAETVALVERALEKAKYRRSDAEIVSDTGIKVVLGTREYTVRQRSIDDESAWLEKCGNVASEIVDLLFEKGGPAIADVNIDDALLKQDAAAAVGQLLPILRKLLPKVLPFLFSKFTRDIIDLFFEYSGIDRETVKREGATHLQVFSASVAVFNTYILPFMVGMVKAMWSGVRATGIMPSE